MQNTELGLAPRLPSEVKSLITREHGADAARALEASYDNWRASRYGRR